MIKVYGKEGCSKCENLKGILNNKGVEYEYIHQVVQEEPHIKEFDSI